MKLLLTAAAIFSLFLAISCSKGTSGPNAGAGATSLFPLTQGSTWYYSDSAFSDSVVLAAYLDTMTVTKETFTDANNTVYLGLNDPNGWFFGSFISVDPTNKAIYEVDSPAYSAYTFFAAVSQDGQLVGSGSEQVTPGCAFSTTQYGNVTPVTINGFSCLTNIEKTVDCNNIPQEEIDSYVSPGTGVVRIVHYLPDSTSGGPLHEDYSQTLISAVIKK
jgi:hypothetical protein